MDSASITSTLNQTSGIKSISENPVKNHGMIIAGGTGKNGRPIKMEVEYIDEAKISGSGSYNCEEKYGILKDNPFNNESDLEQIKTEKAFNVVCLKTENYQEQLSNDSYFYSSIKDDESIQELKPGSTHVYPEGYGDLKVNKLNSECDLDKIKSDNIDITYHDLKSEKFMEARDSYCEVCKEVFQKLVDISRPKGFKSTCRCQDQRESNIRDLPDLDIDGANVYQIVEEDRSSAHNMKEKDDENDEKNERKQNKSHKKGTRKKVIKRPWSEVEAAAVMSFFQIRIKENKSAPPKQLCEECIKENKEVLSSRRWRDVKYYVYNYMKKLKK